MDDDQPPYQPPPSCYLPPPPNTTDQFSPFPAYEGAPYPPPSKIFYGAGVYPPPPEVGGDYHNSYSHLANKPSVRIYCEAETNHMLAIFDGKVILARADPSDLTQHWVKDEKYSTEVKDEDGFPSFALINKATGQALKHSIGFKYPVQLIPYSPDYFDESILWTTGKDLGDGYRQIRMLNNVCLVFDAFHGDKNHGGVHDGTRVVLWKPGKGDNQRWKIEPYCKSLLPFLLLN